jgi:CarD family transcriptional regulator
LTSADHRAPVLAPEPFYFAGRSIDKGHLGGRNEEPTRQATAVNDRNPAQGERPSTVSAKSPTANDAPIENAAQRYGFNVNEFIVYPTHGVGQILAIEEQEIAGAKLELFVINFMKDKMTLRVPTKRVANVRMRKLSDPETIQRVGRTLSQRRRVPVGHWFRLAQEYEAKINSGDIIAIAEVMRDLYRPAVNPGQSHSERQLYEAALDRLAEEVSFVQQISKEQAIEELEKLVIARAGGRA